MFRPWLLKSLPATVVIPKIHVSLESIEAGAADLLEK